MSLVGRMFRRVTGQSDPPPSVQWGRGSIDWDRELPFLQEQVRSNWSTVPIRTTGPSLLDNFTNETPEMRTAYRRALAEPSIKAALMSKIFAVQSLPVQCKPAGNTPLDKEVAEFVKHCLTKCKGGSSKLIWNIIAPGLIDGFSVAEKVYRQEQRGRFRGKKTLLALKSKDTRYIQYEIDAYRNITRVFNMRGNAGEGFPPTDFVLFSHMSLFESPWGLSDLRAAYRAAEMIPAILRLRMIFLDKYTGPFIWAKVGDPAMVEEMLTQLAKARAGGVIATTPQDDLQIIDMATRGTSEFLAAIKDLREEVAIGVNGAFLTMMTGDGGSGARGNSEVQQDTVDLFIWNLADNVASVINEQLVPDLVDGNYGSTVELPTVSLEEPNPEKILQRLKIFEALSIIGLPLSGEQLYDVGDALPPKTPQDAIPQQSTGLPASGADPLLGTLAPTGTPTAGATLPGGRTPPTPPTPPNPANPGNPLLPKPRLPGGNPLGGKGFAESDTDDTDEIEDDLEDDGTGLDTDDEENETSDGFDQPFGGY